MFNVAPMLKSLLPPPAIVGVAPPSWLKPSTMSVLDPLESVTLDGRVTLYAALPSPVTVNTPSEAMPPANSVTLFGIVAPEGVISSDPGKVVTPTVPKFNDDVGEMLIGSIIVAETVAVASANSAALISSTPTVILPVKPDCAA